MPDTRFRCWMTELCQPEGNRPEWPLLLQWMLQEQLAREQAINREYGGDKILISRVQHDYEKASGEKRAVYGLYHKCFREASGCLTIGSESYWLLSYEVPNQERRRMQRADLLGLTVTGGLVVFECKLATNSYAPIASLLEGLDYLAALTSESNFTKLKSDFLELRDSVGVVPKGFENIEPTFDACHEVIVLAPSAYYGTYDRSRRGTNRGGLGNLRSRSSTLRFGFAESELNDQGFFSSDVAWYELV